LLIYSSSLGSMTTDQDNHQGFLAEAAEPTTDPQRLLELVGMNHPEIAAIIARHPRISLAIIENLLPLFPEAIMANPAIEEIDRGYPDFFQKMFSQNLNLLRTSEFPVAWQRRLLHNPSQLIRSAIATNPYLAATEIQHCLHSEDSVIRQGVAENSALGAADLDELSYDPDPLVRLAIAKNINSSVNILERLSKDPVTVVRAAVARNLSTVPSTLLQLAQDSEQSVRRSIAANPHSSQEVLDQLAMDSDPLIAESLAQHSQASADLLSSAALNPAWTVKVAVAGNIKTPVGTLISIAELFSSINSIDSFPLRKAIAQNPNTPDFLLSRCLVTDDSPSRQEQILLHLSYHLNTPDELLDVLADHEDAMIQENIVNHPNLHHPTLVKLAHSSSWNIQQRALERINSETAVIDRQTYIAEAEASFNPGELVNPANAAMSMKSQNEPPFEITLLSAEDADDSSEQAPSSSLLVIDNTNWDEPNQSSLSQFYGSGEHLSAMHPLALLLTMLTMLCLGLGLTLWVKSVPPEQKAIVVSPSTSPSATPQALLSNNYYSQAISIANAATIASQRAVTTQEWEYITKLWTKAISLLEAVPPSDPKYLDAQSRASNYKNILSVANLKLEKPKSR
jgi:hypothetical protein